MTPSRVAAQQQQPSSGPNRAGRRHNEDPVKVFFFFFGRGLAVLHRREECWLMFSFVVISRSRGCGRGGGGRHVMWLAPVAIDGQLIRRDLFIDR